MSRQFLLLICLAIATGCSSSTQTASGPGGGETEEISSAVVSEEVDVLPLPEEVPSFVAANYENARKLGDRSGLAELAEMSAGIGQQLMQEGNKKGYDFLIQAGDLSRRAQSQGYEFDSADLSIIFYNEACGYASRGDKESGMRAFRDAMETGFTEIELAKTDPDLDSLRSEPEFEKLVASAEAKLDEVHQKHAASALEAGESFGFDFSLTSIDGEEVTLEDFAGKVTIVDVWGTWCPPCREEIPSFIKLQEKYGKDGFQIVGINYEGGDSEEEDRAKVKEFATAQGINYPCVIGTEEVQEQIPDFQGYPTTLFLDRSGTVRLKIVGAHEYAFLEAIVRNLLQEQTATL